MAAPALIPGDLQEDILQNLRQKELREPRPAPNPAGPYIRGLLPLVRSCLQICNTLEVTEGTFFLACHLMNRVFTAVTTIDQESERPLFQLILLVCIGIAAKFVETSDEDRNSGLLDMLLDLQYSRASYEFWEWRILTHLQWKVNDVTVMCFAPLYLSRSRMEPPHNDLDADVEAVFYQLLAMSAASHGFLRYPPSVLAAAALKEARWRVGVHRGLAPQVLGWGPAMVTATYYTSQDLYECCSELRAAALHHSTANRLPPVAPVVA